MKKLLLSAVCVGLLSSPAIAEYTVKGLVTCEGIMSEDSHQHFREYNKWWILGYFSARNYASSQSVGAGIDDDNLYQMALNYCQANPKNDWDDAAIHIYSLLE